MASYITPATAEDILSRLEPLRLQYASATTQDQRVEAAAALAELYCRLRLTERAAAWLRVVSPLSEQELDSRVGVRYHLAAVTVWLDRGDHEAAARVLEKLRNAELSLEQEREFLAATVQRFLLTNPAQAFAPLEKAMRHLRHHPSPLWSARFLLWRARWQDLQGKSEEVSATRKKALAEALKSGDREVQLQTWLAQAAAPASGKAKALRAARTAWEKAVEWDYPLAASEASWALGQLTVLRETESSRAFLSFREAETAWTKRTSLWERDSREEDERVWEAYSQDRRRREADLLASLASRLAGGSSLSRSLDELYLPLCSLMTADVFGIALWVPEQQALDYALFIEEGRRTRVGLIPVDSTRSLGAWCFRSRKPVRINDIDREYGTYLKELSRLADHRPKSMLFQPLLAEGQPLGIITVQSFAPGSYGPEAESQLAVIAACVALRLQAGARSGEGNPEVSRH